VGGRLVGEVGCLPRRATLSSVALRSHVVEGGTTTTFASLGVNDSYATRESRDGYAISRMDPFELGESTSLCSIQRYTRTRPSFWLWVNPASITI
jgi:hypothetical protein